LETCAATIIEPRRPGATHERTSRRSVVRSWSPAYLVTVKVPGLVAVPPAVVTVIAPLFAPLGTVAVMVLDDATENVALVPPIFTLVAPVKFVPVTVTVDPARALAGVKPLIVGGWFTTKFVEVVATPPGVVTRTGPVVAPEGTVAMIEDPLNLNEELTPLKVTEVAPVSAVPLIVTLAPIAPFVGEKLAIDGGAPVVTLKVPLLIAVPPGVVIATGPVVAPGGTTAVTCVDELIVKPAATPLNFTPVAPRKLLPVIVTALPVLPNCGEKPRINGDGITVKLLLLEAVPPGVVTVMGPDPAPPGTVVVSWVADATVNVAPPPLNATAVAPVKSVPVTVTDVPAAPLVGVKPVMVGADKPTVNDIEW